MTDKLDLDAIKARAEAAVAMAEKAVGNFHVDLLNAKAMNKLPALAADVLALLEYIAAYEKALAPLRGKTFTYVPGHEWLNTVRGPNRDELLAEVKRLRDALEEILGHTQVGDEAISAIANKALEKGRAK